MATSAAPQRGRGKLRNKELKVPLSISLSVSAAEWADGEADRQHTTRSAIIERLIAEARAREGADTPTNK